MSEADARVLVLGIGNVLMGDEGVGVEVVRKLGLERLPPGVTCLDGGTGGFGLLGPLSRASRVILIDATADERPPGTITRLRPRFSSDYPPSLTAHDIGLKDLLDASVLIGEQPEVTLFAISIEFPQPMRVGLSRPLREVVDAVGEAVLREASRPRENRIPA